MATRPKFSEAETLEQYRIALDNALTQTQVAAIMAELGYDATVIDQGKALLAQTRSVYNHNKTEDDETTASYASFATLKEQLAQTFDMHRKKAKVVFRTDPVTANQLAITGAMPRTYITWLEVAKKFYSVVASSTAIQGKLARLKITTDDIANANTLISKVEAARSEYLKEKGESQVATQAKDAAFKTLEHWMSEFYAVAKIGLVDNPQLLEVLGKIV